MSDQLIVFATLLAALALFVKGRWRYDIVAVLALLTLVLTGVVSEQEAFLGFGHPAVVTVAGILIISRGLLNAGLVDQISRTMLRIGQRRVLQVLALTTLVAVCSAFMNNVGALALLMPVAIQMARRSGRPSSELLMPVAFGSLLGGLMTLIGTPPNIIIATFREERRLEAFGMFDFTPVGAAVTIVGILFISLVGWRLIPHRRGLADADDMFDIGNYVTEVRVSAGSKLADRALGDVSKVTEADIRVIGIIRDGERLETGGRSFILRADDVLIVRAGSEALMTLIDDADLELAARQQLREEVVGSENMALVEAVVMPGSPAEGQSAQSLDLRRMHGTNLLAVARQGARLRARLANIRLRSGDVLLLQGPADTLRDTVQRLGCLPLAHRGLTLGRQRRILFAVMIFGVAIASVVTGLVAVQVAIVAAAGVMVLSGLLRLQEAYDAVNWPVVILLGALIPVGEALERTGAAELVAQVVLTVGIHIPAAATVAILFVVTMLLSNVINNAAAAILMAPIAITLSEELLVSADPFLMAVAVAASSAFLTPIGHQSNTLVLEPGGYQFSDYWRLGLPTSILVAVTGIVAILRFFPL